MQSTIAMLVVAAGACGAAACSSSSSSEGRLDAGADMTPEAAVDACVNSSPPNGCPVFVSGGSRACTWAQAEQSYCADAGTGRWCSANSCGDGINAITCAAGDSVSTYYYDPSGAFVAELDRTQGGEWHYGPCSFNFEACNGIVDAGCASGDAGHALDSGSADSSAD